MRTLLLKNRKRFWGNFWNQSVDPKKVAEKVYKVPVAYSILIEQLLEKLSPG